MREINWKKFIYINKKFDEGMMMPKSIVIYLSKPWTIEYVTIQGPDPTIMTQKIEGRITEYRKLLIVDLWLVEFRFDWIKKISYPHSDTCVASDIGV
jgi:hypothetical protein